MKKIEIVAKNVEEAIEKALIELNTTKDKVSINIIEEGSKGFLNMFGSKPAKVEVTLVEELVEKKEFVAEDKIYIERIDDSVKDDNISIKNIKAHYDSIDYIDEAKAFLRDILNGMDILAEIRIKEENDIIYINLTGPKMGLIIGYRGETLDAIQYLVSLVVNKGHETPYKKIILDTENYRAKREATLKRVALKTAAKVRKTKRPYKLEPMNPYERRIIHSALQEEEGIITYSEGEEPYRRIIVDMKR